MKMPHTIILLENLKESIFGPILFRYIFMHCLINFQYKHLTRSENVPHKLNSLTHAHIYLTIVLKPHKSVRQLYYKLLKLTRCSSVELLEVSLNRHIAVLDPASRLVILPGLNDLSNGFWFSTSPITKPSSF